ncbi:putative flavin-binding monooxygenase-like protein [Lasiodiplodia theobromae]|nr:putative flavin-binding monooxygenase-like protein [Lasiodiplodia theobromae]
MPDPTPLETVDLLIVGAGFHGLSLAATYTTTHPSASLLILDAAPSIGGVWAQSRLYPGLKTNSQAGHFEFADYPMLGNPRYPEVRADEHIAGDSPPSSLLKCADADTCAFTGPIYHVRDFGKHCPPSQKKTILILSANKSAADCAHHHAHTLGNRVIWLIRPSGHGPCFLAPARVTPLKLLSEALITTRAPPSFNDFERLCRHLLHRTPAGRALVRAFHAKLVQRKGVEEPLRLDAHPQTALLKPWHDAFWVGTGRGLLNWGPGAPDVFELVRRGKIEKKKTLEDAYALYRFMIPPRRIHTRTLAFAGVVRTPVTATIAEMQALWLCAFFDHRLPHLEPSTIPPSPSSLKPDTAPSPKLSTPAVEKGLDDVRLHDDQQQQRAMSEISARVRYDAILHARYGAWRYPAGFGGVLPDFFFDTLPLFDLMLAELGLRRWRKGGFVKEVFSSYGPHDYTGLVEEWMELWKDGRGGGRVEEGCGMGTVVVVGVVLLCWVAVMGWMWCR